MLLVVRKKEVKTWFFSKMGVASLPIRFSFSDVLNNKLSIFWTFKIYEKERNGMKLTLDFGHFYWSIIILKRKDFY